MNFSKSVGCLVEFHSLKEKSEFQLVSIGLFFTSIAYVDAVSVWMFFYTAFNNIMTLIVWFPLVCILVSSNFIQLFFFSWTTCATDLSSKGSFVFLSNKGQFLTTIENHYTQLCTQIRFSSKATKSAVMRGSNKLISYFLPIHVLIFMFWRDWWRDSKERKLQCFFSVEHFYLNLLFFIFLLFVSLVDQNRISVYVCVHKADIIDRNEWWLLVSSLFQCSSKQSRNIISKVKQRIERDFTAFIFIAGHPDAR